MQALQGLESQFKNDPGAFLLQHSIRVARDSSSGDITGAVVYVWDISPEEELDLAIARVQTPVGHLEMMAAQPADHRDPMYQQLTRAAEEDLESRGTRSMTTSVIPGAARSFRNCVIATRGSGWAGVVRSDAAATRRETCDGSMNPGPVTYSTSWR